MSNLPINPGQPTIDSREIAEMLEVQHKEILRKLEGAKDRKGYIEILTEHQMVPSDYFIPSTYKDESGKENKCYLFTKLGCEFIANKFTGEKGVLFTAKYVKRFNEMERTIKNSNKQALNSDTKQKEIEARYNNSLARRANVLLKIANSPDVNPRYKQILQAQASAIVAGKPLLPLPEVEQKTYSAEEIGKMLGISANMVGRLAKQHNLKTEQYGKWYHDKSKHSCKEVETFRYYENIVPVLQGVLSGMEQ
jgi:Rha family phage regulatory protein